MFTRVRYKEWFDRYKYAELAATSTALLCSQLAVFFTAVATAYLITFAEYFAFYAVIITISYKQLSKHDKITTTAWQKTTTIARNLLLEFGYPIVLDLVFVRPFCMYTVPLLTGHTLTGVIAGKICADIVFYFLTIINYELLKRKTTQ